MKESLIFGSTAAKHWFPDFPREPHDLDLISKKGFMSKQEQHYFWPTFSELLEINKDSEYLDPELLVTVKAAHMKFDVHWLKTAYDLVFFYQKGLRPNLELYRKLLKDFTETYSARWVSLKGKDSESFFKDAVKRVIPHDDLHLVCAYYERPLYERILKNPETKSVECCEKKFNLLSEEDKTLLVKEEVFATALERFLIPTNFRYGDNLAYSRSLKKLVTTMSGDSWFSRWMIFNYDKLQKNNDWNFIKKFKQQYKYE